MGADVQVMDDGQAALLMALLMAAGIDTRLRVVFSDGRKGRGPKDWSPRKGGLHAGKGLGTAVGFQVLVRDKAAGGWSTFAGPVQP